MKWIGVTGSWRNSSPELEGDLKREVTAVLEHGDGIVAGGALGVDNLAARQALDFAPDGSRIKVILPTPLNVYSDHYQRRASEGIIKPEQARSLIALLEELKSCGSLIVGPEEKVDKNTYYLRNQEIINMSDELLAFHVNNSEGTQHTIDLARSKGIPVKVFTYTV